VAKPGGVNPLGHLPASLLSYSPFKGMRLRRSTDTCPKELTGDVRGFFNSLLSGMRDKYV
jgi:hypothetical protein